MSKRAIVCSIPSDSHTWNLIYMQLLVEEQGYDVINLGCCLPIKDLVAHCHEIKPDIVVVSTINGHGSIEGRDLISEIRRCDMLQNVAVIIGGELTVNGMLSDIERQELLDLGFQGVFSGKESVASFLNLIGSDAQCMVM